MTSSSSLSTFVKLANINKCIIQRFSTCKFCHRRIFEQCLAKSFLMIKFQLSLILILYLCFQTIYYYTLQDHINICICAESHKRVENISLFKSLITALSYFLILIKNCVLNGNVGKAFY